MATTNPSQNSFDIFGDISCGGQLGLTLFDSAFASQNLWVGSQYNKRPARYVLSAPSPSQIATLPKVQNYTLTTAQIGFVVTIKNNGVNSITINEFSGTTIYTLQPAETLMLVASVDGSPDVWVELMGVNTTNLTLQDTYDNSIAVLDTPQIVISSAPVSIGNASGDGSNNLFTVGRNDGSDLATTPYMSVRGLSATSSAITMLNASATGITSGSMLVGAGTSATSSNVIALGRNITGSAASSVILSDGVTAFTTNTASEIVLAGDNGILQIGGLTNTGTALGSRIMPGILDTDPNKLTTQYKTTITGTGSVNIRVIAGVSNTSYNLQLSLIGIVTTLDGSSVFSLGQAFCGWIKVNAVNTAGVMSHQSPITTTSENVLLVTTTLAVADSAGNLNLTITNPSNALGADVLTWLVVGETTQYTFA